MHDTLSYHVAVRVLHSCAFITAVLILVVGLVYTVLLLSWQFLLRLPRRRIFKWSRNPRIQAFFETYNTPYTPKHRYWTGLLLIGRIVLYLVAAANVSNSPTIALTAVIFVVCCIIGLRLSSAIGSSLYRKWPLDVLETFFCLNILFLATFTWYSLDNPDSNNEVAAYISVTITFPVLLVIILYHVYTYTSLFSTLKETKTYRMLAGIALKLKPRQRHQGHPPPAGVDVHGAKDRYQQPNDELDDLFGPANDADYNPTVPLINPDPVPTHSEVELSAPTDPNV
jgi:hypothetical protein